ncbi:MAG: Ger(x)C family spore germination protein [Clostridia bacterium]|nr:Ger(x)C family spore germination protein [Clostridia bacterium]
MIVVICIVLYIVLNPGNIPVPAENIDIPTGVAVDQVKSTEGSKMYKISIDVYTFGKKDQITNMIISGTGLNMPATREARQLKSNHRFIYGLQKVIIFSEEVARSSFRQSLDMLFSNQFINDMGWLAVSKGRALDILTVKVDEYPTSADFIEGLIQFNRDQNFYSDNYKLLDSYVRIDSEGRNLVLPCIEARDNRVQVCGAAVFDKDKLAVMLNLQETKIMNFLRENNSRGILTQEKGIDKVASLYGSSKRKIKCQKTDGNKYKFNIDVEFKGDVLTNNIYDKLQKKPDQIEAFQKSIAQETEEKCKEFIEKMQKEFKVDCLELGRVAAAKYGRGTGADWSKIISESEINISVKVKVDRFGRGSYNFKAD